MSNYRETVRDMMRDLKTAKKSPTKSTAEKKASKKSADSSDKEAAAATDPAPNEEDLLDEILDLENDGPVDSDPIDDEEADKLLASSDKGM